MPLINFGCKQGWKQREQFDQDGKLFKFEPILEEEREGVQGVLNRSILNGKIVDLQYSFCVIAKL